MIYRKQIPLGVLTFLQVSNWSKEEFVWPAPRSLLVLAEKHRTFNKSFRSAKNENMHYHAARLNYDSFNSTIVLTNLLSGLFQR